MMKYKDIKKVKLVFNIGSTVKGCVKEAISISKKLDREIEFDLNGHDYIVNRYDDFKLVMRNILRNEN